MPGGRRDSATVGKRRKNRGDSVRTSDRFGRGRGEFKRAILFQVCLQKPCLLHYASNLLSVQSRMAAAAEPVNDRAGETHEGSVSMALLRALTDGFVGSTTGRYRELAKPSAPWLPLRILILHFRVQPYDFPNQDFIFCLMMLHRRPGLQRLLLRMFRYGRLHAVETPLVVSFFFRFEFLEAVKATVGSQ